MPYRIRSKEETQFIRLRLITLFALGLLLYITGCVGYQLGSMLPPDIRSVYIPTFVNDTDEPLLEIGTTRAAIEEFQRDGSLNVLSERNADTILHVNLTHFDLLPLAFDENTRTLADEYRILLTASILLKHRVSDEVIAKQTVQGDSTFIFSGDLTSAKRRAIPEAAEDLAHNIVERVVEAW